MIDNLSAGDYVLLRLRDGMDPKQFGGTLRVGTITGFGIDALEAELLIDLDDDGPAVYASQIVNAIVRHPAIANVR